MIRFIQDIEDEPVGGKAKGLQMLREIGLKVPDAFVLIHPRMELLDDEVLIEHLRSLGAGLKAVRSSAVSEDGHTASFAGQFETYLNLGTFNEIKSAIHRCIEASKAVRVKSYSGKLVTDADLRISVILQNMINAKVAGVVFSANPVNNRRDKILVNAISGQGEALVSGMKDAHHYELFRSGSNLAAEAGKNGQLLNEDHLREILLGTKKAEVRLGKPVDLEWAIDQEGSLHWLQVRPITTLGEVHYNEFDAARGESKDIWTLGNIGEMMPGVATPLTYSVSAEAIDYGMTLLAEKAGAYKLKDRSSPRYIQMFYNRLFINMTNMMDYPKRVWLNKAEDVQFALSGKIFPGIEAKPEIILPFRILNFFKQLRNTVRAKKHLIELKKLESGFHIDTSGTPEHLHKLLEKARIQLGIGFGHHLMTSAQSGTLYSTFMRIMTDDRRVPSATDHHTATMLLLDIPEIESADAVKSLERFANLIRRDKAFSERFTLASQSDALTMLQQDAPEEIRQQFNTFIERHGHRCVRESELREKTWEENPRQLIQTLQTKVRVGDVKHVRHDLKKEIADVLRPLPLFKRVVLRMLVSTARKAVARREISKALSIKMVNTVRKAYRHLARMLVSEALLDDTDQIYFLTHEEIGLLIRDQQAAWRKKAGKRREILPELDKLVFEEISFGIPEPLDQEVEIVVLEGQLKGTPVSSGVVEGRAHIIHSLDDAEALKEGEIMVASFTDIGWTPYFSIIAGLITEIGSPLSHGAVVAREYGIPAVVGAKGAKRFLQDGDMVRLDGNRGIIEKVKSELGGTV